MAEPPQHAQDVTPYSALPPASLPAVWCPCGSRMRPNGGARFPHQFQCDACDACVDIHPPSLGWQRRCGGMIKGLRCGRPLLLGNAVCDHCAAWAVDQLITTGQGRRYLLDLLGADAVAEHAMKMRRAKDAELARKRAERDAARQDDVGHVVYYARLGANHIKIGTTGDLPRRMVELRVVNASNLLAAEPGGYALETQRHEQFKKWRYAKRREDFGEGPDLLDHIAAVRAEHGPPYEVAARTTSALPSQDPA